MSGILGKKIGMTRILKDDGRVIPITVVLCEPNEIAQVKTAEKDGYPAIVLGFSKLKKPTKNKKFHFQREFKIEASELEKYKKGESVTVESFTEEDLVEVSAVSKGKGFQGVMKRYHFAGGPRSHGSHFMREPGSIGCRAKPGRVFKGKKLPGRMGGDRITLKKIKVELIDKAKNIICLKGCVPGGNGTLITIKK